jgi:hypothetical protein
MGRLLGDCWETCPLGWVETKTLWMLAFGEIEGMTILDGISVV